MKSLVPQLLLALIVAALTLLVACSKVAVSGKTVQANTGAAVPVTVATVILTTVPVELTVIGTVEAYSTVMIKSQIEGAIDRVYFKEGQDVHRGDLLFTIDPRSYEGALKQAEATLARDVAQEKNANAQANRYSKLLDAGIVSKDQHDQFSTNDDALSATVNADRALVENAKVQLERSSIRSPLDGRAGSLLVHQGNIIKPDDATLVTINQITPIYVDFFVPESSLSEIKEYQARGPLKVRAEIPDSHRPTAQGNLSFIDNVVDSTTGTIRLKADFPNADKRLWPGQFVNVVLRLTTRSGAIVAPSQAVQTGQDGQFVFVVKADRTAESRPVTVDWNAGGQAIIQKGLQPGEVVVIDGQLGLTPGSQVQLKNNIEGS